MKRCPECRRDYHDDSLSYCLDDGTVLVDGPQLEPPTGIPASASASGMAKLAGGQFVDEPATAIFSEAPTKQQAKNTDQTAILTSKPVAVVTGGYRLDRRLLAAPIFIAIVALGFFGYRYLRVSESGPINSIAVMPFENRSGSTDTDYLSDGLTDSLIFRFSQLPNLKVSPTSSVMRYKGSGTDVAQVAKELDVDAVLSGRLSQLGDNLTISVQLIDTRSKKLIWAEQYDRKMADMLATQREIATTITQKLQLKLASDEKGITKKYTNSNEAYQLYLKGRYYWAKRSKDEMFKAIDSYKQAIALDPDFALAYAAMAEVYNSMAKDPDVAPKDAVPFAKTAATRALELDPTLPEAHSAFGDSLAIYDWNWADSEREFKRALELDPNISYIHLAYSGSYLGPAGKLDEAVKEAERAVEQEPLSLINNAVLASAYIYARQYDKAVAQAQKTYDLDPGFPLARHWLGMSYVATQQYEKAISISQEVSTDSVSRWLAIVVLGHAYAKMGRRADAEKQIAELRDLAKTRYIRPYYIASIYAALGDKDNAFAELERSFQERDVYLNRINGDPFMDPLRDDPRFKTLLQRMNLPAH
jgi:TolB-like protein/predicted Zn-dependent protease